jgi:5-methylcytosine-specific restriction enzyme B
MTQVEKKFSWVQTHKELVEYLVDKENDQKGLIEILNTVGISPLNDEVIKGKKTELSEIDPFTFFCYIYKYGSEKRLNYLQKIAEHLNLSIPAGESGIPSANAQSVWLFPYKYLRKNNEIERLWAFFHAAIKNQITDELFNDALKIRNVAKIKLTEALFNIDPERYFPINGPTIPYMEEQLGIKANFNTFSEYNSILNQIKNKTSIPFYELSYHAWEWLKHENMKSANWKDDELKAAVNSYMEMLEKQNASISFVKQDYYNELASKFNRTEKAFEYRMQNISHVLKEMGRGWLNGLAPAKNVGTKTEEKIKKIIREYENMHINSDTHFRKFGLDVFIKLLNSSGLLFSKLILSRFAASLLAKPFIILTGLSGSGKTKLAQAFVQWICQDESQYRIIPVGADWTNREPLLGYPNALNPEEYVKPDSGVLDLLIRANNQPDLPYFLILDEMNLSHVERYFADFLSVMESKEEIPLYAEGTVENGVPSKLKVPSNLFIIGTVNIDETTNMFSPKVLDRANTIEFRVTQDEMKNFLGNIKDINMDALTGKGAGMARSFLEMAAGKEFATADIEAIKAALVKFFGELKKTGAEFGYRSATEILRLIHQLTLLDNSLTTDQKIDIAIIQKLLPKLHGSRRKLSPVLETLGSFCVNDNLKVIKDVFSNDGFDFENHPDVIYRLSLEKIARMYRGAIDNGFASFAEA